MKICIVGAGSLGCAIGGALSLAGSDVTLINHRPANVDAINQNGLKIIVGDSETISHPKAALNCNGLGEMDLVILLTKAFNTKDVLDDMKQLIGKNTTVVSLQNGLGHEEKLSEAVGAEHVIGGRTYVGGVQLHPGVVSAGYKSKLTIIGELDGSISDRVRAIADEFNKAGLETQISENVTGMMWDKLLVNVSTGALGGITRLPYGPMYDVPEVKATALAAVAEGIAVAKAAGVSLSCEEPEAIWEKARTGLGPDFKPSILQSLEKGTITEVDVINGSVVSFGERYGVATPVNRTLTACIKGIERWLKER